MAIALPGVATRMSIDHPTLKHWALIVLFAAAPTPILAAPVNGGPPPPAAQPLAPPSAVLGIPPAKKITLAEALTYARAHQPAVRAALARVQAERANAEV